MSLVRVVTLSAAFLAAAQAAVAQDQPTKFTIKVENISQGEALKLSTGKTAPFVSAPVLWAVHGGSANPLFVGGRARLHTVPVFIAIMGGLAMFGSAGMIVGPVILVVTVGLLHAWRERMDRASKAGEPPL